ncbi:sensor histidine kinase [Patulibacter sp. SYSU D01012]|uniref:sensor histidine kinase n=1 Tax=Patulibacter sp. SYSU D01012 TaxID=2817381 RepID=UPI001B30A285|nr:sensor histidine kinase [Patulibacter sp. SYSU D01012]
MTAPVAPIPPVPPRDRQPWFAQLGGGIWLVYLLPAARTLVADDGPPLGERIAAGAGLAVFVALYLTTLARMVGARRARTARQSGLEPPAGAAGDREMAARAAALAAVALTLSAALGGEWVATLAFVAPVLAVLLDRPWPFVATPALVVLADGLLLAHGTRDASDLVTIAFAILVAGSVTYGVRRRGELEAALDAARERNARLAVAEERARIGRDLHDLLGHSLSVVAVKAELAERLLERGRAEQAAAEVRDVRAVARDALREVRQVVDGYRSRPLSTELASAAAALRAAGAEPETALPDRPVPPEVEAVLAFVVREATTNVLRHADARRCRIAVAHEDDAVVATVTDDGPASLAPRTVAPDAAGRRAGDGHGLTGLAERLAPLGGVLTVGPGPVGGTTVTARVPLAGARP